MLACRLSHAEGQRPVEIFRWFDAEQAAIAERLGQQVSGRTRFGTERSVAIEVGQLRQGEHLAQSLDIPQAVAGVLVSMYYGLVNPFIGFMAGLKAFTAAVLGGIGSIPGAMLGGVVLGLAESFASAYLQTEYKDVVAFALLILVLLFRPTGLLGRPDVEKV